MSDQVETTLETGGTDPAPVQTPQPQEVAVGAKASAGGFTWGTGRRKSAVARVRIKPGEGKFLVNKREIDEYFCEDRDRQLVVAPLEATATLGKFDVWVGVSGGGFTGQAGAVMLGVARALRGYDPSYEQALRDGNYLTRDSRMKERKKYGQRGARRRFQFSKR